MEHGWYLFPGQTLENTKICDRGHALHATATAWSKITGHLDRNQLIQEAIEKEQARKQAMKNSSYEMTKTWANSQENIRKRREEERVQRLQKMQDERMESFLKLRAEQQAVRQQYIDAAYKRMYLTEQYPKAVNGARVLSEVLYEREKQMEFEEKLKEYDRKKEEEYAAKVKREAEEERIEKKEKEIELHKKKLEVKESLFEQMRDIEKRKQKEHDERFKLEAIDNVRAIEEMEEIRVCEKEQSDEKKKDCRNEYLAFLHKRQALKERMKVEQAEQDVVVDILDKFRMRFKCLNKQKQQDLIDEGVKRGLAATKGAVAGAKAREEKESQSLEAAIAEQDRKEEQIRQQKEAYQKRLKQEREDNIKDQKLRKAKALFVENEVKKWEMLNRYKQDENYKTYEANRKSRNWHNVIKYRHDLFKQMGENEMKRQMEKKEREYSVNNWEEEDKKFFEYAQEVLDEAEKNGRTKVPILQIIEEYKKDNYIDTKPKVKPCTAHRDVGNGEEELLNKIPGKMCHDPSTDPTYGKKKSTSKMPYE